MNDWQDMIPIEPTITTRTAKDTNTLIVPIADAVNWNNQTPGIATYQEGLYTGLINTAREIVEKYCWLDLTQSTYQAYYELRRYGIFRQFIANLRLLLNKSPVFNINNILLIEYLDNDTGAWNTFNIGTAQGSSGLYANVTERVEPNQWASLYFITPPNWADTINAYKARVTFTAGYDWSYSGAVSLSYNATTGIVTAVTASPNLLNNNGMSVAISGATPAGYNIASAPVTVINNTTFTYQLATGLTLVPGTGNYVSTPNNLYTIPFTLLTAIRNIISYQYGNRGDTPSQEDLEGYPVPAGTRAILNQYSITRTRIGQPI